MLYVHVLDVCSLPYAGTNDLNVSRLLRSFILSCYCLRSVK